MNKKHIALVTAFSLTAWVAVAAEVSSTEQQITLASNKRMQEIAIARIPIETRYFTTLQLAYKKAEAAKDLELQVKIKREIEIVGKNIECLKADSVLEASGVSLRRIYGVKFYQDDHVTWVVFNQDGKFISNMATGTFKIVDGSFVRSDGDLWGNVTWKYSEESDCFICSNGNSQNIFYREGAAKNEIKRKASGGEAVDTLFGRKVK